MWANIQHATKCWLIEERQFLHFMIGLLRSDPKMRNWMPQSRELGSFILGIGAGSLFLWNWVAKQNGSGFLGIWVDNLFSEVYCSWSWFLYLIYSLLIMSSFEVIISTIGWPSQRLHDITDWLESLLRGFTGSVVSFGTGYAVVALFHSVYTSTSSGAKLFVLMMFANALLITASLLVAFSSHHRIKPFNTWYGAFGLLVCTSLVAFL